MTGRKFEHANLTEDELIKLFIEGGIPEGYARPLAMMDTMIANGGEDRLNDVVQKMTGRPPKTFRKFAEQNRDKFM